MIKDRLNSVRERVKSAAAKAGRDPSDIVLVCVTKEVGPGDVREAIGAGVTDAGENKVQDAVIKYKALESTAGIRKHFIGHLQTNKVKNAVAIFDLIHSVDSIRLAKEIDRRARQISKMQAILLQVNVSGEAQKYGLRPGDAEGAVKAVSGMKNLMLLGLMTIAPYSDNPENSRPYFRKLKELRANLLSYNSGNIDLKHLSMGMSGDFETAIEEGADIVRIGTAIFGG